MAKLQSDLNAQEQARFEKAQRDAQDATRSAKEKEARLKALQKFENYPEYRDKCPTCDAPTGSGQSTEFPGLALYGCSECGFNWTVGKAE